jgi:hypothetical protein
MYSPSRLFQLQALQSLAPGKDHTHFNLNVLLRASLSSQNSLTVPDKKWGAGKTSAAERQSAFAEPLLPLTYGFQVPE